MLLSDYNSQIRELVHDLATVDWADSELTNFINNARKRVALDSHCVRALTIGLNAITNQESYPMTGGVGGYVVTAGGSGYVSPVITVAAAPAGGITATANVPTANLVGGVITGIFPLKWGAGYTATPAVTITDSGGPGAGATATAIALINVLDIVSIASIWPGSLMSRTLNWSPFTEFQAWVRAYRNTVGWPAEWSHIKEQNTFYLGYIPDQAYGLEIDAVMLPNPLVNLTDSDLQVIDPWADAVQWWGAYLAMMKLQNYTHASYFEKAYDRRIKQVIATKQTRRIRNVYMATYRRRLRGG